MGTEKLYYQDSHMTKFLAGVLRCEPVEAGFEAVSYTHLTRVVLLCERYHGRYDYWDCQIMRKNRIKKR